MLETKHKLLSDSSTADVEVLETAIGETPPGQLLRAIRAMVLPNGFD